MIETIRVAVGMKVADFNRQPAVARQAGRLDPGTSGVFAISERHRLALEVNGRVVTFETGAPERLTYVTSGFYVHNSLGGRNLISSVNFTTTPEPITLEEALAIARERCSALREARLAPARPRPRYAAISESYGDHTKHVLTDERELISAFADPQIRARTVELCELEDDRHVFGLTITNERRAREGRYGPEPEDPLKERVYTVLVHFAQNLEEAIRQGEGAAGR